ncbi:S66 family peptidase [Peribacillus sp. B-H-3]|uniref:S66 family peptidase n=1 Tax=Peribacillus sp. B-H-3 TaxID=3400420 RepID=UPI003B012748
MTKLKVGDEIRIIAPSRSLAIIKGEQRRIAEERLNKMGFAVTFGKNSLHHDEFFSNSIEDRIADLHDAFKDPNVKGILSAAGGYNANQLLGYLDFDLIRSNPKVFCGYGDSTALSLAIYKKTGMITYSGPDFSSFGMKSYFDYTVKHFAKAIMIQEEFELDPSDIWNDESWLLEDEQRVMHENPGYHAICAGEGEGVIIAGSLSGINSLQGTEYMPSLSNSILFLEENEEMHPPAFDRGLQSLLQHHESSGLKGLVIGRFQKESGMTDYALQKIIDSKKELHGLPVISNASFGHVHPFATIPIGAKCSMRININNNAVIKIFSH